VLAARGSALEREFTFWTVRQLFDPVLVDPADRGRVLAGAAAGAARVFAAPDELADEQTAASFSALHGLYWLTANVVPDERTLVAIDDLHLCDIPSLRFLAHSPADPRDCRSCWPARYGRPSRATARPCWRRSRGSRRQCSSIPAR
jgi:hypothetical protein